MVRASFARFAIAAVVLAAAAPLLAQNEEWSTEVSLQATAANFEGRHVVDELNAKTGISGSELVKNLRIGGAASVFGKGDTWAWGAEGWAVNMRNTDIQQTEIAVDQTEAEVDGMYQVHPGIHFFGGARYLSIRDRISATREAGFFESERKETWVEPVLGFRFFSRMGSNWRFNGRVGIGGFGVGSDFSWDVGSFFSYDVSKSASIGIGYRVLAEDFKKGKDPRRFKYDTAVSAVTAGVNFRF